MTEIRWTTASLDMIVRTWAEQYTIDGKKIVEVDCFIDVVKKEVAFKFYVEDKPDDPS